jgi:hypothetical protein
MTASRVFALIGLALAIGGAVGAIAVRLVDHVPLIETAFGFSDAALVGFEFLGVTFAAVGSLLVVRLPRNLVGWLMVLIGVGYALSGLTAAVTSSAVADGAPGAATAGFAGWLTVLFTSIGGLVFALGFIFPTGRGHTRAWDRLLRFGAVASPLLFAVLFLFRPGSLHVFPGIDNPFGIGPDLRPIFGPQTSSVIAGSSVFLLPILAWSIVSRYRMADRVARQQLKWFILSLLVALGAVAATSFGALVTGRATEAGLVVFGYAGALVPIAIGIAILRHHLYDIDRIVSRTIAYAIVSAILGLVVGGVIVLMSTALAAYTEGQTIAVAASTLIAFAAFQPVLRRVRAGVDRRFDRARYDAERTVAQFADRLRDQIDLADLSNDLDATIHEAIAPRSFGIWLRESDR